MGCLKKIDDFAVTEIISTIMVFLIITGSIAAIMFWAVPYMSQAKSEAQSNSVYNQFFTLDEVIKSITRQGINTSRSTKITLDSGNINIKPEEGRIVIFYTLDTQYIIEVGNLDFNDEKYSFDIDITCAGTKNLKYIAHNFEDKTSDIEANYDTDDQTIVFNNYDSNIG